MSRKNDFKNSFEHEIENVRVPWERTKMYVEDEEYVGNYDIALLKTKKTIIMIPSKVQPVSKNTK